MQDFVPLNPPSITVGQGDGADRRVDSLQPLEDLNYGYAGVLGSDPDSVRYPQRNSVDITLSANAVADGTISGALQVTKLDGTVVAPYTLTQAYTGASHANTMAALATQIEGKDADLTVELLPNAAGNAQRVIRVTVGGDKRLAVSTNFTSTGTSAPTFSNAYSSADRGRGGLLKYRVGQQLDGTGIKALVKHGRTDVVYQGGVAMRTAGNPQKRDLVYVLYEDYTDSDGKAMKRGSIRPDTDNGAAPVLLIDGARYAGPKIGTLAYVAYHQA